MTATRTDKGRAEALNAALSGLQVVAAHVRAAVDSDGAGRVGLLPCDEKAGLVDSRPTGAVAAPRPSYRVMIQYYQFDPARTAGNPVLACYPGSGTSKLPGYAVLASRGEDGRPNGVTRTVTATYLLRNTNQNIPGGLIRVCRMPGAAYDLCFDAGPVMPTASNAVELRVQRCDRDNPQQRFAYHANLNLVYEHGCDRQVLPDHGRRHQPVRHHQPVPGDRRHAPAHAVAGWCADRWTTPAANASARTEAGTVCTAPRPTS